VAPHGDHFVNQIVAQQRNSDGLKPLLHCKMRLWLPSIQIREEEQQQQREERITL
jgi:hypothetical protein